MDSQFFSGGLVPKITDSGQAHGLTYDYDIGLKISKSVQFAFNNRHHLRPTLPAYDRKYIKASSYDKGCADQHFSYCDEIERGHLVGGYVLHGVDEQYDRFFRPEIASVPHSRYVNQTAYKIIESGIFDRLLAEEVHAVISALCACGGCGVVAAEVESKRVPALYALKADINEITRAGFIEFFGDPVPFSLLDDFFLGYECYDRPNAAWNGKTFGRGYIQGLEALCGEHVSVIDSGTWCATTQICAVCASMAIEDDFARNCAAMVGETDGPGGAVLSFSEETDADSYCDGVKLLPGVRVFRIARYEGIIEHFGDIAVYGDGLAESDDVSDGNKLCIVSDGDVRKRMIECCKVADGAFKIGGGVACKGASGSPIFWFTPDGVCAGVVGIAALLLAVDANK
ncbi:unnamed protein product, partial [Prorocentrum cordatum]